MAFFGVNFILQKFCPCKKNDKYKVCDDDDADADANDDDDADGDQERVQVGGGGGGWREEVERWRVKLDFQEVQLVRHHSLASLVSLEVGRTKKKTENKYNKYKLTNKEIRKYMNCS